VAPDARPIQNIGVRNNVAANASCARAAQVRSVYKKISYGKKLAAASLLEVLQLWSGLGYNRRGKFLYQAAQQLASIEIPQEKVLGSPVSRSKRSRARLFSREISMPQYTTDFLERLPGVGPYTARAVATFAYNRPEVFVETNIRTVFIHYFFKNRRKLDSLISDKEILPLVAEALQKSRMQPRDFYAALMDYGAYLKQKGIKLNVKSKQYTKQSKFKGSYRELRGTIIRALLEKPMTIDDLVEKTGRKKIDVARQLAALSSEGIIGLKKKKFAILD